MKIFLGAIMVSAMVGSILFAGGVHAQTVTADQMIGAQTRVQLDGALDTLQGTLNVLRARLNTGNTPASPQGVNNNLENIEGTLSAMRSTLLAFDNQARTLALGGTPGVPNTGFPGLPNTGGGGAAQAR
ncbi:MAG: hypothetical protein FJY98_02845 [Candidatus Liptonbacteria bacterium]|nr:hypothetical protein [Candidatus Liptonbacteria bacterium]